MELHERIRFLRKNTLKMSQTEFGQKLAVSRSVINNLESNVLARPDQKLSLLKLMCKEFNVNENWLLNGKGEMFAASDKFDLNEYIDQRGATLLEKEIIRTYFDLDEQIRKEIMEHFKSRLISAVQKDPALLTPDDSEERSIIDELNDIPDTPEELERQFPPVDIDDSNVG